LPRAPPSGLIVLAVAIDSYACHHGLTDWGVGKIHGRFKRTSSQRHRNGSRCTIGQPGAATPRRSAHRARPRSAEGQVETKVQGSSLGRARSACRVSSCTQCRNRMDPDRRRARHCSRDNAYQQYSNRPAARNAARVARNAALVARNAARVPDTGSDRHRPNIVAARSRHYSEDASLLQGQGMGLELESPNGTKLSSAVAVPEIK
jgi:hypothetical protein